jgi:hypothetical protein
VVAAFGNSPRGKIPSNMSAIGFAVRLDDIRTI